MFVRAYLRASTSEQDAGRARQSLLNFAADHNHTIASFYTENESGASLDRPELLRLIDDAQHGDIILIEQVDRLARLKQSDWEKLKSMLAAKRLAVVSPELPTSHVALSSLVGDEFTSAVIGAVNGMLLDMLAAIARKDYMDRKRRQKQGIAKAKDAGKYAGRQPDLNRRAKVKRMLLDGDSYTVIQQLLGCSRNLIASVRKEITDGLCVSK